MRWPERRRSPRARDFAIREVSADKGYVGRGNAEAIERAGAVPFIPIKANSTLKASDAGSAWERMYHYFAYRREDFLRHYHKRSNVESVFGMIKAKFGSSVRSKSRVGQINEVLAKVLCHNICVLMLAIHEIGLGRGRDRVPHRKFDGCTRTTALAGVSVQTRNEYQDGTPKLAESERAPAHVAPPPRGSDTPLLRSVTTFGVAVQPGATRRPLVASAPRVAVP